MLNDAQIAQYHRDGYVLVKGAFSKDEVLAFQKAARNRPAGEGHDTHLFKIAGLENLWRDPRLVAIAKQLLGEPITFFAAASYSHHVLDEGKAIEGRHLHHDAKGTPDHPFRRIHTPPAITYPTLRYGIYFQDTANMSGGLKVAPGSHMRDSATFDQDNITYVNIASVPGDLVCFCHRIWHSPYALRPRATPELGLSPSQEDVAWIRSPEAFLPTPVDRESIFIDFASNDELTDLMIKSRALRGTNYKSGLFAATQRFDFAALARESGVALRLDFAVVEATLIARQFLKQGDMSAAAGVLMQLPGLCRLSSETTPYHSLFEGVPAEDTPEAGLQIARQVAERLQQVASLPPVDDPHMAPWNLEKLRKKVEMADQAAR